MALWMEAVSTCEKSVVIYHATWRSIPEDSHLEIPEFYSISL
jgi:hypothetical protein